MRKAGIILAFFLLHMAGISQAQSSKAKNVVILFTDDQRWNTIHALGNDEIHTPNMDRLVRMGVSFTNAHVIGSYHGAVCAPSRAMLLTGRTYPQIPIDYIDQGRVSHEHHFDFTILPEQLKKLGYNTFFTGKWHNHTSKIPEGFRDGDNIFIGGMHWPSDGGHQAPMLWDFDPTARYPKDARRQMSKFSSELYSDAAIRFLENRSDDAPFCLYVAYTSPHDPRQAPEKYKQLYDTSQITLPPNFLPAHPFDNGHLRTRDENLLPFPRTKEMVKQEILEYYAMISEVDAQLGRILDALEARGLLSSTIIVFAGDNGLAVGQHGLLGKQNLYEHSIRVPLVITAPGISGNVQLDALCSIHDIYPTITDLLGIEYPEGVQGQSLFPQLEGKGTWTRDTLFLSHARQIRAIKTADGLKLIRYFVHGQTTEQLFDLNHDPWEMHNLANAKAYGEKHAQLSGRLTRELLATGDAFIRLEIQSSPEGIGRPVTVSMTTSLEGADIRYTTDGSAPGPLSSRYTGPVSYIRNGTVKAGMFYRGEQIGKLDSIKVFIASKIKDIQLIQAPSEKYQGKGAATLANGPNGDNELKTGEWLGYESNDAEILIELKEAMDIRKVGIRYLDQPGNWIFPPTQVTVAWAGEDRKFSPAGTCNLSADAMQEPHGPKILEMEIPYAGVRYLRLHISNQGTCPEWHDGAGKPAWLFLDEIFVH